MKNEKYCVILIRLSLQSNKSITTCLCPTILFCLALMREKRERKEIKVFKRQFAGEIREKLLNKSSMLKSNRVFALI